jgi:enoyl-CoA hydratase/carnithine racemase
MPMQPEFSSTSVDGHVLTVTFDRPEQRNALHTAANQELGAIFDEFERNPDLWVAIVTGAGDEAFCAGTDVEATWTKGSLPGSASGFAGLATRHRRKKPVIAAVEGLALGAGFEAALACDIIVAGESSSFGLTQPRSGKAALCGGIQRLVEELGPKRAHALLLTARRISAREAAAIGIVAEVVPDGEALAAARRWAGEIAECSPTALAATKAIVQSLDGHTLEHSMRDMRHLPEVRSLLSGEDAAEGQLALAENRKPAWANPD